MGKEKIFIKRYYDVEVDGFTLVTTIRIWDMFDVDQGGYYKLEEELVDEFDMSIADIKKDYAGIRCDMFRDIEEEYNITERRYAVKEGGCRWYKPPSDLLSRKGEHHEQRTNNTRTSCTSKRNFTS